jgi:hypothetical protein
MSDEEMKKVKKKLAKKGIYNVIDAQDRKGRHRKYKGVKPKQEPQVILEDHQDDVIDRLSMSPDQISQLIDKINKPEDKTKIEDIDWKKVRNI